jgi:hypothetical protein
MQQLGEKVCKGPGFVAGYQRVLIQRSSIPVAQIQYRIHAELPPIEPKSNPDFEWMEQILADDRRSVGK